jgi:hypothetical protein
MNIYESFRVFHVVVLNAILYKHKGDLGNHLISDDHMDRFVEIDEGYLDQLLENRVSKNTKASIKGSVNIFKEYCSATESTFSDVEQLPLGDLCNQFNTFYTPV